MIHFKRLNNHPKNDGNMKLLKLIAVLSLPILTLLGACSTQAEVSNGKVQISDAWVRQNAPGQTIGAAYMTLKSPQDSKMVYVETNIASAVEVHSTTMKNGVMKMRMLDELTLKASEPQILAPGSFHLMLFDLKAPLKAGDEITFKLCFEDKGGKITHQNVTLPVKAE